MINYNEVLTFSDQPITCPNCGNRTKVILDLSHIIEITQIHKCLSCNCENEFIVQRD